MMNKNLIFGFILSFLVVVPAFSQGHGRVESHRSEGRQRQEQVRPRQESPRVENRQDNRHWNKEDRREWHRTDRHEREWNSYNRRHWDGKRFDQRYYAYHFGYNHKFRVGRPYYYNGCNHFRYGGYWFAYSEQWLWGYYEDYYIVQDDDGVLWVYNPYHPGWRIRVWVIIN
jgi:hypothetical protein